MTVTTARVGVKEAEYRTHYDGCLECRTFQVMNPTWPYSPLCTQGRALWEAWQQADDVDGDEAMTRAQVFSALQARVVLLEDIIRRMDAEMLPPTCVRCECESRDELAMAADVWERFVEEAGIQIRGVSA